jgi:hypothetical protein
VEICTAELALGEVSAQTGMKLLCQNKLAITSNESNSRRISVRQW